MAQNEMRAMRGLPLRVRSKEGLGLSRATTDCVQYFDRNHVDFLFRLSGTWASCYTLKLCTQGARKFGRLVDDDPEQAVLPTVVLASEDGSNVGCERLTNAR